jgi:hypothetical protein
VSCNHKSNNKNVRHDLTTHPGVMMKRHFKITTSFNHRLSRDSPFIFRVEVTRCPFCLNQVQIALVVMKARRRQY